jgi:ABC-type Fe3+-hydroxamate transport system substrate-binding protein
MTVYKDQMKRSVRVDKHPSRIISLVPSQTELLYDLGLEQEVLGITKFCVHPKAWLQSKTIVGGTKKLNTEKIKELNPDLIIGNKEENEQQQIESLMQDFPVWMSDIKDLDDSLEMISLLSSITGRESKATEIQEKIRSGFHSIQPIQKPATAVYLIWRKPYMTAGKGTFIDDMLARCGLKNIIQENRYPEIKPEQLQKLQPDVILLSSEPFPFKEKHIQEFKEICPQAIIRIVDGEFFSWYGSRLIHAPAYFKSLIHDLQ